MQQLSQQFGSVLFYPLFDQTAVKLLVTNNQFYICDALLLLIFVPIKMKDGIGLQILIFIDGFF